MRAGKTERDAICREEGAKFRVKKLTTVVAFNTLNYFVELSLNIYKEALENGGGIRFISNRKCP
jgi:hypothetical protein